MPFYTAVDHVDEENEKEQILPNSNKNLLTNKPLFSNLYDKIKIVTVLGTYDLFVFIQHLH